MSVAPATPLILLGRNCGLVSRWCPIRFFERKSLVSRARPAESADEPEGYRFAGASFGFSGPCKKDPWVGQFSMRVMGILHQLTWAWSKGVAFSLPLVTSGAAATVGRTHGLGSEELIAQTPLALMYPRAISRKCSEGRSRNSPRPRYQVRPRDCTHRCRSRTSCRHTELHAAAARDHKLCH